MAIFKPSSSSTSFRCFFNLYFLHLRVTITFKNLRSFNSKKEIYSIKTKIYPKITITTTAKFSRNDDIKINLVYYYSKE